MDQSSLFRLLTIGLVAFFAVSGCTEAIAADHDTAAVIAVKPRAEKEITVHFGDDDVEKSLRDPKFLLRKLIAAAPAANCCEPRKKIGDGRWECCDGTVVSTNNKQLKRVLGRLFH